MPYAHHLVVVWDSHPLKPRPVNLHVLIDNEGEHEPYSITQYPPQYQYLSLIVKQGSLRQIEDYADLSYSNNQQLCSHAHSVQAPTYHQPVHNLSTVLYKNTYQVGRDD